MITELDLLRTRLDARRDLLNMYLDSPCCRTGMNQKQIHLRLVAHSFLCDAERTLDSAMSNGDLKCLKSALETTQSVVDRLWAAEKRMLDDRFGMC